MPMVKRLNGEVVKRAIKKKGHILVRLVASDGSRRWERVPIPLYRRHVTHTYENGK